MSDRSEFGKRNVGPLTEATYQISSGCDV